MTDTARRCSTPDCTQERTVRGLCRRHYWQHRRDTLAQAKCTVQGCDRPLFCAGLCRGHYARRQRGGDVAAPLHQRPDPGTIRFICRISAEANARLESAAAQANIAPSALAGRLLAEALGLPA